MKKHDRVPRDIIWWALRKKNVGEEYIKVIQDGCTTSVRMLIGSTESFEVKVGLNISGQCLIKKVERPQIAKTEFD